MRSVKEEIMTNVLTDIKDIMKTEEIEINYTSPKMELIFDFLRFKQIANKSKDKIAKYTERNKNVRNGKTVIVGTRITPKELLDIMAEDKEERAFDYISKQYPSIDSEEKIFYGALYEIRKTNLFLFILMVLFSKNEDIA